MLTPLIASLVAAAGSLGVTPSEPASIPSLTADLAAAAAAPSPRLPQQDYDYGIAPNGWISVGAAFFSSDISTETDGAPDSNSGLSADLGLYGWQGEMGLGLEAGLIYNTYDAIGSDQLSSPTEQVDVWRTTIGVRLADRGSGDRFLPWLRAGFLYRFDDSAGEDSLGNSLSDSGAGFYIGGGFDFLLLGGFALTPQLLYEQSRSVDAKEWIASIALSFLF